MVYVAGHIMYMRVSLATVIAVGGLTATTWAETGSARQLNTFINASKNVCASVYRGDAVSTPREVLFTFKEGSKEPADKDFMSKLMEKASINDPYRLALEPDSVSAAPGNPEMLLISGKLSSAKSGRWSQFLTVGESKEYREAVKAIEEQVEREYAGSLRSAEQNLESIKKRKVRRSNRGSSSGNEQKNREDKKAAERRIREIKKDIKKETERKVEITERKYKTIAEERQTANEFVQLTLLVPKKVASEGELRRAKRLDGFVKITDFTVTGQAADRRDPSYCRNLMPRISAIKMEMTEMRRIIAQK